MPRIINKIILFSCLIFASNVSFADNLQIPQDVINRIQQQQGGDEAVKRLHAWETLVNDNQQKPDLVKLRLVNDFFNKNIPYKADEDAWKKRDYWATPLEFIVNFAGDCEDFAIAKYYSLKKMGIPISKMRLTYARATDINQAHMVLTYYEKSSEEPFILDNLKPLILYASERPELVPIYSFNGDGIWMTPNIERSDTGTKIGKSKTNRMRLWLDLEQRMQRDGLT